MITRWSFILIYSQICPLVSEEKIFKELICIIIEKKRYSQGGLIYLLSKFILAILVDDH